MTDFMSDQPAVQCFLSFTHEDDSFLNFVTPLKNSLEKFCASAHGRKVEVFVDRESIGWGEDWRTKIQDGLNAAMVFVPVISMNYFYESSACREELTAFYAKANELGLTQLILPLIVLGHELITGQSDDANIRIIEKLQYVDIKDAVLAGAGTAEWRRTMDVVADKLIRAIRSAEATLEKLKKCDRLLLAGVPPERDGPRLQEYKENLTKIGVLLERQFDAISHSLDELGEEMRQLTGDVAGLRPEAIKARVVRAADAIKPMAVNIQQVGTAFETTVAETDSTIRSYMRLMDSHMTSELLDRARREYDEFVEMLTGLMALEARITEFLTQIRPLEAINAPLRAAIRPLRVGAQSMQLGMRTMRELSRIISSLLSGCGSRPGAVR
ncbi:toll/interleukin-1 receptor domain-containing protein [Amycolatopsis sp. DG1A-15b]|jgi:DNA-binding ferritin-like protein|uniref:toll/interleukin-1 receptor domain-containing protein n=1 Tax=Amycolatopsis sp. DG1A-15b TaxID=3052846 RepID=UPI00255BB9E8|nr:toll/interleukin-1 receptor domain-containing protein [Amycolatopsis sp. DG1A-15b]WIX89383.1 toll/interleukin-1 receptor domain-containing protein [Amycolatopsis sp. DG1A-15b]